MLQIKKSPIKKTVSEITLKSLKAKNGIGNIRAMYKVISEDLTTVNVSNLF
tara:strand:- start:750 stop:902 length:153 start_codon:yes stop_codon:yes gene_type:complete